MAKNIDVLVAFVNGDDNVKTKNLHIVEHEHGTRLFNYDTCIAERTVVGGDFRGFKVNMTKYSNSTTAIQNKLISTIQGTHKGMHIKVATRIPMGARDLWTV
jgi:hypothetical protein